jgi:hypothetical protein
MASVHPVKPLETWKMPLGGLRVHLSHEEVLTVSDSATPVAALISMAPSLAPLAPVIIVYWWLVKKAEKQYGSRGVDFFVGPLATAGLIPMPPE